jgi:hypothetical protein
VVVHHDEEENTVYLHIHLVSYDSFIKRLIHGVKYIFGYKSKYGAWDEIILKPEDTHKIEEIVKTLKSLK